MATITANKTARTLQSSTSNSAGGTTTGTGLDLTTKFGGLATLIVTNGATGPTIGCDAVIQTSDDNTNWNDYSIQTASVTNSAVTTFNVNIPPETMYARSVFRSNTGQAVTVICTFQELTSYTSA